MSRDINYLQLANATLTQGTSAVIVVAATSLEHLDVYRLRKIIKWTDATGAESLSIQVGITGGTPAPVTYPVLDRNSMPVTIGKLRRRELLLLKFINPSSAAPVIPAHFVLLNDMHPQIIVTPEVTA